MEKLLRHTAVIAEPMLRIAQESFYAVQMVAAMRPAFALADHDMVAAHRQRRVGLPVVRVVEAARLGAVANQGQQACRSASLDGKDPDLALALQDPQHDDLAGRALTATSRPMATKHGFVALDRARQRFPALLVDSKHRADEPEVPLEVRLRRWAAGTQPVDRDSQYEIFHHAPLGTFLQPDQIPHRLAAVPVTAAPTLGSAIAQAPGPAVATLRTSLSHGKYMT